MALIIILTLCFLLLFLVEVYLGGALPASCALSGRLNMRTFFGQALPLAAAGIGLPMSFQHPWALLLVAGAAVLYFSLRRCA